MAHDVARATKAYLKLRDTRTALKREYEEQDAKYKAAMEKLEALFLKMLEDSKLDSMKTELGTIYRSEKVIPSANDWDKVYNFIREHNTFEMLEKRITQRFVKEYMEEHEGALPPGVQVFRKYDVSVRRS